MSRSSTIFLRAIFVMLWLAIVVFLCLVIPYLGLLEIFLVIIGMMVLAEGGVLLAREVSKLIDFIHWQSTRRELREHELQWRKRKQLPPIIWRRRL